MIIIIMFRSLIYTLHAKQLRILKTHLVQESAAERELAHAHELREMQNEHRGREAGGRRTYIFGAAGYILSTPVVHKSLFPVCVCARATTIPH